MAKTSSKSRTKFSLPPTERIKASRDFLIAKKHAKKLHSRDFIILVLERRNIAAPSRIGITVTTKAVPVSPKRNRIKRLIRETFRLHKALLVKSYDIVVIVKDGAVSLTYSEVAAQLLRTLRDKGYMREST